MHTTSKENNKAVKNMEIHVLEPVNSPISSRSRHVREKKKVIKFIILSQSITTSDEE